MKFKARIGSAQQLSKLASTLNKIGDACAVHLGPDRITFAIAGEAAGDGVQVWADVTQNSLFQEYRIESKNQNVIVFVTKLDNLGRALRSCSGHNVDFTTVKLTKKTGIPSMSFEIMFQQTQMQVVQDVPLRLIMDNEEVKSYNEPPVHDEGQMVAVQMAGLELKGMRNVVDRMKSFSENVRIKADVATGGTQAHLHLRVEKDHLVSITTTYQHLSVASTAQAAADNGAAKSAEAVVEIKKLARIFASCGVSDIRITQMIFCIIPNRVVVLQIFIGDPTLNNRISYYLPVIFEGED